MLDATPLLKWYADHRRRTLEVLSPIVTQERHLLRMVRRARDTRFGRDHAFSTIHAVEDFQERVPLRRYEQSWEEYWQPHFPRLIDCTWPRTIPYFAVTSGTTSGVTKYIPCSRAMIRANKRAALDILTHHMINRPQTTVLAGLSFMLGGSTELVRLAPGIHSGDLSGIAAREVPLWARRRYFPPRALETIGDWEEKIARLAEASLAEDIRAIGGTPSWLLLFLDRLFAIRPDAGRRVSAVYPNLQLLIHGGVSFAPYRTVFEELLEGSSAETREVYPASEGFIAVADRGDGEGLRLILDNGLFFEFVPVEELESSTPTRHWMATVEKYVNYAIVVSSCAGLWAHVVGDTVRFVDHEPPRILITGRTSYSLSAFGEHLIGEEIEEAVAAAAAVIGAGVTDYSVGALYPANESDVCGHLYVVEFDREVPIGERMEAFARALDDRLCAANEDYAVHRERDYALRPPLVQAVPPGTFAAWMKSRGQLGGQHKVPRVITDDALLHNLRTFAAAHTNNR